MPQRAPLWRLVLTWAGLLGVPVVTWSLYLMVSRTTHRGYSALSDNVFSLLSVLAGASFILALPLGRRAKIVAGLIYIPIAFALLMVYTLGFLCRVYHRCI